MAKGEVRLKLSLDRLKEIVEIKNDSAKDIDIFGWTLLDSNQFTHPFPKYRHRFVFPKNTKILAGESLFIHTFWGINFGKNIYQNRKAPMWNNPQDVAILMDEDGKPIDVFPEEALRTISGTVYKFGTKKGISGANVIACLSANPNAPGKSVETDNRGAYKIDKLAPAEYIVTASKEGYVSEEKEVDATNEDAVQDFYLKPSSKEIKVIVKKIEITPEQPEWNKTHEIKVTFENQSEDVYHLETTLYRRRSSSEAWSETPGAYHSFDETIEENGIKEVTFTAPKDGWMDWDWFSIDALFYAKEEVISKKINYQVRYKAVRDKKESVVAEGVKEFETSIEVSKDKKEALKKHNNYITSFWLKTALGASLTVTAAAAMGIPFGQPAAILLAIAAAAAYAAASAAWGNADKQKNIMNDP